MSRIEDIVERAGFTRGALLPLKTKGELFFQAHEMLIGLREGWLDTPRRYKSVNLNSLYVDESYEGLEDNVLTAGDSRTQIGTFSTASSMEDPMLQSIANNAAIFISILQCRLFQ